MTDIVLKNNTVCVEGLTHDGRGIAVIDGKKSFISGALPHEVVQYQLHRKYTHYNEGAVVAVLEASPERVMPRCPHFGVCGGCSEQFMSERLQVEYKQNTLLQQLNHFGRVTPHEILEPISGDHWGYRRKARLGVKYVIKKNKLLVGFREKSSRYLTETTRCLTLHPLVGERLEVLAELISSLNAYQHIPQIEVSMGDENQALIFRCLRELHSEDKEKLVQFGKQYAFDIYLEPSPPQPLEQLHVQSRMSRLSYCLPDFDLEFLFHPKDFTQVHAAVNRKMVAQAISLLQLNADDVVLDLFCGIGNFTLPIARSVKEVIGLEGSSAMVDRAYENSRHNQIENARFYAANLQSVQVTQAAQRSYTKVLLDPPRTGAKEILPIFSNSSVTRAVYVSCNPATLARDAGLLVHEYGFTLRSCGILNMFPHTAHVESIAVFDRH